MSNALTAPTTKSSIRFTPTLISHSSSIISYVIGNTPTTACALTNRSPTSPHSNSSPVGNSNAERQSVTNLLDEYTQLPQIVLRAYPAEFLRLLSAGSVIANAHSHYFVASRRANGIWCCSHAALVSHSNKPPSGSGSDPYGLVPARADARFFSLTREGPE